MFRYLKTMLTILPIFSLVESSCICCWKYATLLSWLAVQWTEILSLTIPAVTLKWGCRVWKLMVISLEHVWYLNRFCWIFFLLAVITIQSLHAQADLFADRKFVVDRARYEVESQEILWFFVKLYLGTWMCCKLQSLYYSCGHKMTVATCFNFVGATEAELEAALLDLFFLVLRDDHQVSLLNSGPDHSYGLRFMLLLVICMKTASGVFCSCSLHVIVAQSRTIFLLPACSHHM